MCPQSAIFNLIHSLNLSGSGCGGGEIDKLSVKYKPDNYSRPHCKGIQVLGLCFTTEDQINKWKYFTTRLKSKVFWPHPIPKA